jgi:hypothetical protein
MKAPVRLQRVFAPTSDAQRQAWHRIDSHEVAGRAKDSAGPEVLVLRQVAELHHRLVVEIKCDLMNASSTES